MMWFRKNKEDPNIIIDENTIRLHYQFFGRVQGVGFRFTACVNAQELGLTGSVRNESDGTVIMEIQGDREKINELIYRLCHDDYIKIVDYNVRQMKVNPSERQFDYHY